MYLNLMKSWFECSKKIAINVHMENLKQRICTKLVVYLSKFIFICIFICANRHATILYCSKASKLNHANIVDSFKILLNIVMATVLLSKVKNYRKYFVQCLAMRLLLATKYWKVVQSENKRTIHPYIQTRSLLPYALHMHVYNI